MSDPVARSAGEGAVLVDVVAEHAEEAAFLWLQRASAVHAPNYATGQLADLDERLEAHLDGLRVAGREGWALAEAALDNEGPEDFFPAAVLALEASDGRFDALLERAGQVPGSVPGIIAALGWVEPALLTRRVKSLLDSRSPLRQRIGLAACAVHGRDPGAVLDRWIRAEDAALRTRALRTAGELGRVDLAPAVIGALDDRKREARFWARWSAVVLGHRQRALDELAARALEPGPRQCASLRLALIAMDEPRRRDLLIELADAPDGERLRVVGAGLSGSIRYVPWLVDRMSSPVLARAAAEAFVTITGADFDADQLEAAPPDAFEEGPTEDPDDEDIEVPEDIALPWPDAARVGAWWDRHRLRFDESTRYFLGAPLSPHGCTRVLETGFQRQRELAALALSVLEPGTPVFNTSAPARRQQMLLARTE